MVNELAADFAKVPPDFPALPAAAGLAGAQPKLALTLHQGKYHVTGDTPPERYARWLECEDLAQTFVVKCQRNEHGKYAALTRQEILEQYLRRMLKARLASPPELQWVIGRTADILGWPFHPGESDHG